MPSQRKRIGFLPTAETQEIINEICNNEKISQSKVTGILVEEALRARASKSNQNNNKDIDNLSNDKEFKMVKEFIEFKKFKYMLNKAHLDDTE